MRTARLSAASVSSSSSPDLASGILRSRGAGGATWIVRASDAGVRSIELLPPASRAATALDSGRRGGPAARHVAEALEQLRAYFDGKLRRFTVALDLSGSGTEFQRRVWSLLLEIPYGAVRSYADVAARAGMPRGARAIGGAVGKNPIPVIIPCHRVVGASGRLTGFGLGLGIKSRLLELEGFALSRAARAADSKVLS
jgi:O-6-methylguanine DNA methyltransferase